MVAREKRIRGIGKESIGPGVRHSLEGGIPRIFFTGGTPPYVAICADGSA